MDNEKLIHLLNETYKRAANTEGQEKLAALEECRQEATELFSSMSWDIRRLSAELEYKQRQMEKAMNIDALTGLYNQEGFAANVNTLLEEASDETAYYIVYTNVTNFRFYNMVHGRVEGDQVLQQLARQISSESCGTIYARAGQDNFVYLVTSDIEDTKMRCRESARKFSVQFGQYGMELKFGVSHCENVPGRNTAAYAIERAKLACDSIRQSPDCFSMYTESLHHSIEIETYVIQHLDEALKNHYIKVLCQPVVRTVTGKICSMEALARWVDPVRGLLSPKDFIPALESNRLITKLDLYMLEEACQKMRQAADNGAALVPVSFNFSRIDFFVCNLAEEIDRIAARYDISHDLICIEITESAVAEEPEYMKKEILHLREQGYAVWMDDFGSGYSSLNILRDIPVDEIKLDMKFMNTFDARTKTMVTGLISMAKRIGIQTLTEGVETKEQYEFLRDIGSEKVQGFYKGKPVPMEEILNYGLDIPEHMEKIEWRPYYERISAEDFVTDKALAVYEYDGSEFRLLYHNQKYEQVVFGTGISDMGKNIEEINSPLSALHKIYNELRLRCEPGGEEQSLAFTVRDHLMRLNVRCLAACEENLSYAVELIDLSGAESDQQRTEIDKVGRQLFQMFEQVFAGDYNTKEVKLVHRVRYDSAAHENALDKIHTIDELTEHIAMMIHPDDRQAFLRYFDHTDVLERMKEEDDIVLADYFRIRQKNNEYAWKVLRVLYLADSDELIYTIHRSSIVEKYNRLQSENEKKGLVNEV